MSYALSICIPTYNRLDFVDESISCLDKLSQHDFEIVVVNEPEDKDSLIPDRYDCDVKYIENESYAGFAQSILHLVDNASGKFLWFCSDEDRLNPEMVPEIIEIIKENEGITKITDICNKENYNVFDPIRQSETKAPESVIKNLTQFNETVQVNKRTSDKKFLRYQGRSAVEVFFWSQKHLSRTIIHRESLDTSYAKKYVGTAIDPYMPQVLNTQAIVSGDTIYLPPEIWEELYFYGDVQIDEHDISYTSNENRAKRIKLKVEQLIPDLVEDSQTAEALYNQERERAAMALLDTAKESPTSLPYVLWTFISTKRVVGSVVFWYFIPTHIIRYFTLFYNHVGKMSLSDDTGERR